MNGSQIEDFKATKGLRQGDSLAHFLFLIGAEGLTRLVNKATQIGVYIG